MQKEGRKTTLVLNRRIGERVVIDGPCEVIVDRLRTGDVRLRFHAARSTRIMRAELIEDDLNEEVKE